MLNVVAEGPFPMGLNEWIEELSRGWTNESEPQNPGKLYDPVTSPTLSEPYDPADDKAGNKDQPGLASQKPAA